MVIKQPAAAAMLITPSRLSMLVKVTMVQKVEEMVAI